MLCLGTLQATFLLMDLQTTIKRNLGTVHRKPLTLLGLRWPVRSIILRL